MTEEIIQAEALTDAEKQQLFGWGSDIFGATNHALHWRPKGFHFLLYLDKKPISHVGILRHVVSVEKQLIKVGGVGSVVTIPEAQGKGWANLLMRHAATFLAEEWKVDAGLLFCLDRMRPYYERLGWQIAEETVMIEQPSGKIASPMQAMVLLFGTNVWPHGTIELNSLPW